MTRAASKPNLIQSKVQIFQMRFRWHANVSQRFIARQKKKVVWPPFWAVKTIFFSAHYLLCKRPS
jgi:hypothetical protein